MSVSIGSLDHISPRSTNASSSSSSTPNIDRKVSPNTGSIQEFDDITFLKKLSKAKFAVYLVESPASKKRYALKAFPFQNERMSARYQNEARFSVLSHPNIVSMIHCKDEMQPASKRASMKMSYILMEYAPYGDFFDFVINLGITWDDKLIRTYFHQLIEGIEHLHSKNISHLDLKLENLLVGEDFTLKIADFDLAHMAKDGKITTKGTRNYRAPELLSLRCTDPQAADLYSAAVILFVMKCEGVLPHLEEQCYKGINLCELLHNNPEEFWEKQCKIQSKSSSYFDKNFMSMFIGMTRYHACERSTISEVKSSKWYQGPIYSKKDLKALMHEAWTNKTSSC